MLYASVCFAASHARLSVLQTPAGPGGGSFFTFSGDGFLATRNKGILCILASALCFAFMNMFVHLAGDLPSFEKAFFRNIVAFFFALIVVLRERDGRTLMPKGSFRYLMLRAVCGTVGILGNFYAIDHLVLSDATMLNKMSPFFAIIFSFVLMKERLTPTQILIVAGAFVGSLFVIKPTFSNLELLPSLLGFLGGMGAGMAYATVRKLSTLKVNGPFIVLFFSAFSSLVTLPSLFIDPQPMSAGQLLSLLMAGLAAAGGQFSITAAYRFAPAREISVYEYSQIIFSALLGWTIFGQVPDVLSVIGYLVILSMAFVMFFYNKKQAEQAAAVPS